MTLGSIIHRIRFSVTLGSNQHRYNVSYFVKLLNDPCSFRPSTPSSPDMSEYSTNRLVFILVVCFYHLLSVS